MKIINQLPRQAHFLLIPLSFFLITACPDPPETIDCGTHQVEVNGDCECEEGYHWDEDQSKCLMDTTSHNFTWEIDTLGSGLNGSFLLDVSGIDEDNVWAVGEIFTNKPDSTSGTENSSYNSAYWNGNDWKLEKIQVPPYYFYSKRTSIYTVALNDVWMGSTMPTHWNGVEWQGFNDWQNGWDFNGYIKAIWGNSSSNIYFIGKDGGIVHYDGNTFTKMESGTDIDLISISGTGPDNVWICGWDYEESVLLHFDGNDWSKLLIQNQYLIPESDNLTGPITSVYTDDPDSVWALTPFGIYRAHKNTDGKAILIRPPTPITDTWYGFPLHMGGKNHNDIFITGYYTTVWHYNGKSFHHYDELSGSGPILESAVIGNQVFLVGASYTTTHALVYRGTRFNP